MITAPSHIALTDTFVFYKSETRLSLTLVELANLPSHKGKPNTTWRQEYPTESLHWGMNSFTLVWLYFDISKGIVNGIKCWY